MHPDAMTKREICGADASAEFKRTDFGLNYAIAYGFAPEVKLAIQVEAAKSRLIFRNPSLQQAEFC